MAFAVFAFTFFVSSGFGRIDFLGSFAMWSGVESKPFHISYKGGGSPAARGGTIIAAST